MIKVNYEKIEGKMLVREEVIPLYYLLEFKHYSTPSLIRDNVRYHSLVRFRKFLNSRSLDYRVMEK